MDYMQMSHKKEYKYKYRSQNETLEKDNGALQNTHRSISSLHCYYSETV